ncbi:MAG: RnfABCDGE type electron transport complex subunit B [Frisingicoccus sp.]
MGIIVVVVIGLIAGLILSVASIVFAVPVNEKEEALVGVLPGANCGACGFAGCSGYAAALAEGSAEVGLCSPGGPDVAAECAEILGVSAGSMEKKLQLSSVQVLILLARNWITRVLIHVRLSARCGVETVHVSMVVLVMVIVLLSARKMQLQSAMALLL